MHNKAGEGRKERNGVMNNLVTVQHCVFWDIYHRSGKKFWLSLVPRNGTPPEKKSMISCAPFLQANVPTDEVSSLRSGQQVQVHPPLGHRGI